MNGIVYIGTLLCCPVCMSRIENQEECETCHAAGCTECLPHCERCGKHWCHRCGLRQGRLTVLGVMEGVRTYICEDCQLGISEDDAA